MKNNTLDYMGAIWILLTFYYFFFIGLAALGGQVVDYLKSGEWYSKSVIDLIQEIFIA